MSSLPSVSIPDPVAAAAATQSNRAKKRQANQERRAAPYPKKKRTDEPDNAGVEAAAGAGEGQGTNDVVRGQSKGKGKNRMTHTAASGIDGVGLIPVQGVSKLKAAIRQTTRLLARETLDPALRISTTRRLASLKLDLARQESKSTEREFGKKYHMVKFFDRKKLLRIITRAQRFLALESIPDSQRTSKASNTVASKNGRVEGGATGPEAELWRARVMLNFVDHFPNTQKYISLFPTSTSATREAEEREQEHEQEDSSNARPLLLPPHLNAIFPSTSGLNSSPDKGKERSLQSPAADANDSSTKAGTDKSSSKRLAILLRVDELMRAGELSVEPEVVRAGKTSSSVVDIMPVDVCKVGNSRAGVPDGGKSAKASGPIIEEDDSSEEEGEGADQKRASAEGPEDGMEDDFFE